MFICKITDIFITVKAVRKHSVSLFTNFSLIKIFPIIFAFSLTDIFNKTGTFIGTGRRTGNFTKDDNIALGQFKVSLQNGLRHVCGCNCNFYWSIFGTSNTTTSVKSSAGIETVGRTRLIFLVTVLLFVALILIVPFAQLVPACITVVMTVLSYSISNG